LFWAAAGSGSPKTPPETKSANAAARANMPEDYAGIVPFACSSVDAACRMTPMGKKLSGEQIERYRRDGFVYPVEAFTAEEARRYRCAMEEFEATQAQELTKGHNFKPHLLFTWVDEIVHHPAVLDAVEDVIGPDIRLFHLSVWPKNAGDAAYVSWHQDATYFGLEPPLQVTAWVALTDASIEAGCMEVIPGSHKLGQLHHAEHGDATHNLLSRGQTITASFDKSRTAFMPVRAGQFSLHHTHLVHNSRPNLSADRRIGLGISYIPTGVRCTSQTRLTAMLVRGTDRYGHFDGEPRPRVDFGDAERAAHADAVARFRASNADQTSRYEPAAR
jgi:phytanoyl-CoA dioxygenase PhyH